MDASAGAVHGIKMERWKILNAWEFAELKKCDVLNVTNELVERVKEWTHNEPISESTKLLRNSLSVQSIVLDYSGEEFNGYPEFISVSVDDKTKELLIEWDTAGYREFYIKRKWSYCPEKDILVHISSNPESDDPEAEKSIFLVTYSIFMFANKIMLEHKGEVLVEKVAKSHSRKTRLGKRKNIVRHFKCYSITGKNKPESKEKHKILCPAWSVRGHTRHYKSGKVVFINPYIKGKKRNESEFAPKEHKIFPTIKMEVESGKAEGL